MQKTITFDDILRTRDAPAVAVDEDGIFFFVNERFGAAYGWTADDLIGKVITTIMPPYMRDAHTIGFSRFLSTEAPRILGKTLRLPVYSKDGTVRDAEHFILARKTSGAWEFAALITPVGKQNNAEKTNKPRPRHR